MEKRASIYHDDKCVPSKEAPVYIGHEAHRERAAEAKHVQSCHPLAKFALNSPYCRTDVVAIHEREGGEVIACPADARDDDGHDLTENIVSFLQPTVSTTLTSSFFHHAFQILSNTVPFSKLCARQQTW